MGVGGETAVGDSEGLLQLGLLEMGWGQAQETLAYHNFLRKHVFYPTASTRLLDQRQTSIYLQKKYLYAVIPSPLCPTETQGHGMKVDFFFFWMYSE